MRIRGDQEKQIVLYSGSSLFRMDGLAVPVVAAKAPTSFTDSAGNALITLENIGPGSGSTRSAALALYGGNGLGVGGQAWAFGVDVSATTPYRDFFMAKILSNGAVSDPDGFYISNGGSNPATIGIGAAQPADGGNHNMRCKMQGPGGSLDWGVLQLIQGQNATDFPFVITDYGNADHLWVDPSVGSAWCLRQQADTTTNDAVHVIQNAGVAAFTLAANGNITIANPGAQEVQISMANTNSSTNYIQVDASHGGLQLGSTGGGNLIVLGSGLVSWASIGFFGATPITQPAKITAPTGGATVDSQARTAITSLINLLSAASSGYGLTA